MSNVGQVCNRSVVVAHRGTTIVEAAGLMRDNHVGDVVVIEDRNGLRVPIGVLTDRDLVVGALARCEPYLAQLTIGDLILRAPVVAREHEDVLYAAHRMRVEGVRRLPVIDKDGSLVGIISMDDVLGLLAQTLLDLSALSGGQRRKEAKLRP